MTKDEAFDFIRTFTWYYCSRRNGKSMLIMAISKAFGMEVDMTKERALEIIANQKLVYVNTRTRGLKDGQIDTEEKLKIFDDLIKAYDIAIEELQKGVTNGK